MNGKITRHSYQGAIQIFQHNWTFYAAALLLSVTGIVLLRTMDLAMWLRVGLIAAILVTVFWGIASLAVSHYVYDRSPLYQFEWLRELLAPSPSVCVNIHAGLDETSRLLMQLYLHSHWQILDIYEPTQMTEPAIKRARSLALAALPAISADFRELPLAEQSCDVVFVIFTAHELRAEASRLLFFAELHRVLRPQGKVILVEHLRDWPNFLAFGPGAWHFLAHSVWLHTTQATNFAVMRELKLTPFVSAFCLGKQ